MAASKAADPVFAAALKYTRRKKRVETDPQAKKVSSKGCSVWLILLIDLRLTCRDNGGPARVFAGKGRRADDSAAALPKHRASMATVPSSERQQSTVRGDDHGAVERGPSQKLATVPKMYIFHAVGLRHTDIQRHSREHGHDAFQRAPAEHRSRRRSRESGGAKERVNPDVN